MPKSTSPTPSLATHHQNVRWGAFVLLLGLIAIAAFSNNASFYFLLYALGGLILLVWVWVSSNLRSLSVARKFDHHAFHGQQLIVRLDLRNKGLWPILWLQAHENLPIELSTPNFFRSLISVAPRERLWLEYKINCRQRGYYTIGPLDFQTGDFWGLFEGYTRIASERLVVYPHIIPLGHLNLPSQAPFGDLHSPQRLIEDPTRSFGARPYQAGDSLRKVDWKTTAATGNLQVKRFQSSIALDAYLFLNLNQDDYPMRGLYSATEMGITVAASLAAYLSHRRQAVGMTVLGLDPLAETVGAHLIPIRKGHGHLVQLLELLARIQKAPTPMTFAQTVQQRSARLPWGTTTFIISASAEANVFDLLPNLRRRGLQPVLVLTFPEKRFEVTQAQAKALGIPCFLIETEKDLDIWRDARGAKVGGAR